MCFRFHECFGFGDGGREDFGRAPSTPKGPHAAGKAPHSGDHGVQRQLGYHHYGANGHKAASTYPTPAADEAWRKACNDVARKDHPAAEAAGGGGGTGYPALKRTH